LIIFSAIVFHTTKYNDLAFFAVTNVNFYWGLRCPLHQLSCRSLPFAPKNGLVNPYPCNPLILPFLTPTHPILGWESFESAEIEVKAEGRWETARGARSEAGRVNHGVKPLSFI